MVGAGIGASEPPAFLPANLVSGQRLARNQPPEGCKELGWYGGMLRSEGPLRCRGPRHSTKRCDVSRQCVRLPGYFLIAFDSMRACGLCIFRQSSSQPTPGLRCVSYAPVPKTGRSGLSGRACARERAAALIRQKPLRKENSPGLHVNEVPAEVMCVTPAIRVHLRSQSERIQVYCPHPNASPRLMLRCHVQ